VSLTAYSAKLPQVRSGVVGKTHYDSAVAGSFTVTPTVLWGVGDFLVVIVESFNNTDPTGVTETTTSIALTKLTGSVGTAVGFSVWIGKNNTTSAVSPTASVTFGVATTGLILNALVITNASSYNAGAPNVSLNTSLGAGGVNTSSASGILLGNFSSILGIVGGHVHSTDTGNRAAPIEYALNSANPPSLGAFQTYDYYLAPTPNFGLATFIAHSEDFATLGVPASSQGMVFRSNTIAMTTMGIDSGYIFIEFVGTTVTLDDNTFQLGSGPLLNNPANTIPIYDIESVDGISDLDITNSSDAIDGTDGSYVEGKFISGKTIVFQGTIYGTSPFNESAIDNVKSGMRDRDSNGKVPLYFKPTGQNPRSIPTTPVSFKAPYDRGRALSTVPFQLQCLTDDAYFKGMSWNTLAMLLPATGTSRTVSGSITQNGNADAYPDIYFTISNGDMASPTAKFTFTELISGKSVVVDPTSIGAYYNPPMYGLYKLSMNDRSLTLYTEYGTIDWSSLITTRGWWTLKPKQPTIVQATVTSTSSKTTATFGNYILVAAKDAWL